MKDAFGGVVTITFIAVFLVIVSGVLGLTVSYTKAFRMKNFVISAIEKYEARGCFSANSGCRDLINEGAKKIGYSSSIDLNCPSGFDKVEGLFCYQKNPTDGENIIYKVITQVDIDIPIINKLMGLSFFQINGDTRPIEKGNW
jgi:hypothetical protein